MNPEHDANPNKIIAWLAAIFVAVCVAWMVFGCSPKANVPIASPETGDSLVIIVKEYA